MKLKTLIRAIELKRNLDTVKEIHDLLGSDEYTAFVFEKQLPNGLHPYSIEIDRSIAKRFREVTEQMMREIKTEIEQL